MKVTRQLKMIVLGIVFMLIVSSTAGYMVDSSNVAAAAQPKQTVKVANAWSESGYKLTVNGKQVQLKASMLQQNGVTYITMADLFSSLNIQYQYEKTTNTVIAKSNDYAVTFKVGETTAYVNGTTEKLSAKTLQYNNRIYVPLRPFAELFSVKLTIDSPKKMIKLTTYTYEATGQITNPDKKKPAVQQTKLSGSEIVDKLDESIVTIVTDKAQGSGIVIGKQLIITNLHVIEEAKEATIETINGDTYEVKGIVVADESYDLAIIMTKKVMTLPVVTINDGLDVRKGDLIYALGSPQGISNTISEGLISNQSYDVFQFSAPIDFGSSGGALIDEYGNVIGITTAKLPRTTASIGYAITGYSMNKLTMNVTEQKKQRAAFRPAKLPASLEGEPLTKIKSVLREHYSSIDTSYGSAKLSDWNVERDASNWLVLTANVDPIFYMYYGIEAKVEIQNWLTRFANEFHDMLPKETIQLQIFYDRDYNFEPRGLASDEVQAISAGKWKVRYPVFELQFKDQLYMKYRDI